VATLISVPFVRLYGGTVSTRRNRKRQAITRLFHDGWGTSPAELAGPPDRHSFPGSVRV
jgi:hypothetical protein